MAVIVLGNGARYVRSADRRFGIGYPIPSGQEYSRGNGGANVAARSRAVQRTMDSTIARAAALLDGPAPATELGARPDRASITTLSTLLCVNAMGAR